LQDYDFILQHVLEKINTKTDILSRKNQVDTQNDNKDVQMFKKELWIRKTMAEVTMLKRNKITDNLDLLKKDMKKQYQRTRSTASIEERRWTSMGTRQNSLY